MGFTTSSALLGQQAGSSLGASAAGAGDVNGDGFGDAIVGAPLYDAGQVDEGAVFLFHGGGDATTWPLLLLQQRRGDASGTPVQPWGGSSHPHAFEIEATVTHPDGNGYARLETEVCPAGVAFADVACTRAIQDAWHPVFVAGPTVLSLPITGLTPDTVYRWRARVHDGDWSWLPPAREPPPSAPSHGPWRRLNGGNTSGDIRLPEPAVLPLLASGCVLLLLRRRASR